MMYRGPIVVCCIGIAVAIFILLVSGGVIAAVQANV
jgi:hypothetical protein